MPEHDIDTRRDPAAARLIVVVLCVGGLCAALMQTLVIPIQGRLPALLDTSASNASWVVTATLLGGAVAMPLAGRLADMLGKQRVLVASAVILLVGCLVCAVSDSVVPMLAGRALQGIAMGFIPVAISLVREVTPPAMAASAIATLSATLGVGGAIGLPLSAWIVENFDWHALFWISAVLAAIVLVSVLAFVPNVRDAHPGKLDVVGAVGVTVGLASTLIGVSKGNDWGWGEPSTLAAIIGGVVVLVLWGIYEVRHPHPLVNLRSTAQAPVLITNLAAILIGFGMMAQSIVVPQLLQLPSQTGFGLGQTLLETGLWMAPGGLMMMVFAPISGRLIGRLGPKIPLVIGAAVLGAGYLVALLMMSAPWEMMVAMCVCSAGVGIGYAAMPTLILEHSRVDESASAVGLNTLMRSIGTTSAGAVMALVLTGSTTELMPGGPSIPTQGAFEACFIIGAAAAAAGAVIALLIPRSKTAPAAAAVEATDTDVVSSTAPA